MIYVHPNVQRPVTTVWNILTRAMKDTIPPKPNNTNNLFTRAMKSQYPFFLFIIIYLLYYENNTIFSDLILIMSIFKEKFSICTLIVILRNIVQTSMDMILDK